MDYTLIVSSRPIVWEMPDVWDLVTFAQTLPDPITAAVIKLLSDEGSLGNDDDPQSYHNRANRIKGMYGIVAACLVSPKLDLSVKVSEQEGVIGRTQIGIAEVEEIYYRLFRTPYRF